MIGLSQEVLPTINQEELSRRDRLRDTWLDKVKILVTYLQAMSYKRAVPRVRLEPNTSDFLSLMILLVRRLVGFAPLYYTLQYRS